MAYDKDLLALITVAFIVIICVVMVNVLFPVDYDTVVTTTTVGR